MTANNRQQALIPHGAILIENPVGTAPGFIVETDTLRRDRAARRAA
jgi:molybdopterin-biosynthesis enzyme MoeA-like protein